MFPLLKNLLKIKTCFYCSNFSSAHTAMLRKNASHEPWDGAIFLSAKNEFTRRIVDTISQTFFWKFCSQFNLTYLKISRKNMYYFFQKFIAPFLTHLRNKVCAGSCFMQTDAFVGEPKKQFLHAKTHYLKSVFGFSPGPARFDGNTSPVSRGFHPLQTWLHRRPSFRSKAPKRYDVT